MKKLMSLVIAVLFAFGITTVAFAADATAPATTEKPAAEKMEKKAPKKKKAKKAKKAEKTEEKKEEAPAK